MIDGSKFKDKKIDEINLKIKKQPLYAELMKSLSISIKEDFMQAELLLEQIVIGDFYIKIIEPNVELLDFFKKHNFKIHTFLPAYESENYNNPIIAWLVKE